MKSLTRSFLAAVALAAWASPAAAQSPSDWYYYCDIQYYRADNMWGSMADAYKSLGQESFRLNKNAAKDFVTDWKYEKKRNDGRTFYGSHGRALANKGNYHATFYINEGGPFGSKEIVLPPNTSIEIRGDIVGVICRRY